MVCLMFKKQQTMCEYSTISMNLSLRIFYEIISSCILVHLLEVSLHDICFGSMTQ